MGIDPEKLFVVFVIALIVLGPDRLPQAARTLGRGLAYVRKYSALVRAEVDDVLSEPRAMIHSAVQEVEMRQGPVAVRPSATGPPAPAAATAMAHDYPGDTSAAPDDPALN